MSAAADQDNIAQGQEVRFRTERGVTYLLNNPPRAWRRMTNPGVQEADFPADQYMGGLLSARVVVGDPARFTCPPKLGETRPRQYTTDSPVVEIY